MFFISWRSNFKCESRSVSKFRLPFVSHLEKWGIQCNTVLEMDHLRFRLLSRIYHTTYLKIICTKILENKLLPQKNVAALILCDLKTHSHSMTFRGFQISYFLLCCWITECVWIYVLFIILVIARSCLGSPPASWSGPRPGYEWSCPRRENEPGPYLFPNTPSKKTCKVFIFAPSTFIILPSLVWDHKKVRKNNLQFIISGIMWAEFQSESNNGNLSIFDLRLIFHLHFETTCRKWSEYRFIYIFPIVELLVMSVWIWAVYCLK